MGITMFQPLEHQIDDFDRLMPVKEGRAAAAEFVNPCLGGATENGARKNQRPKPDQPTARIDGATFPNEEKFRLRGVGDMPSRRKRE